MNPTRPFVFRMLRWALRPIDKDAGDRELRQWQNQLRLLLSLVPLMLVAPCVLIVLVLPNEWYAALGIVAVWACCTAYTGFEVRRARRKLQAQS